jgi:plastocyanin
MKKILTWTAGAALRLTIVVVAIGALVVLTSRDTEAATVNVVAGNPNWFCDASYSMAECPTTVNVGDTVTWMFAGGNYHSSTECRGSTCDDVSPPNPSPLWDSGLHFGGSYSRVFNTPGVYYYMCNFHGYGLMRGKITVVAAVGGVAELPGAQSGALGGQNAQGDSHWSVAPSALAALAATAAVGLAGAWYARRRNLS